VPFANPRARAGLLRFALVGLMMGGALTSAAPGEVVVRRGDSLWLISRRHGISVSSLKAANDLRAEKLTAGQTLKLPGAQPAATPAVAERRSLKVGRGDTLEALARDTARPSRP
jgi:LysM repeat protein